MKRTINLVMPDSSVIRLQKSTPREKTPVKIKSNKILGKRDTLPVKNLKAKYSEEVVIMKQSINN